MSVQSIMLAKFLRELAGTHSVLPIVNVMTGIKKSETNALMSMNVNWTLISAMKMQLVVTPTVTIHANVSMDILVMAQNALILMSVPTEIITVTLNLLNVSI